MSRRLARWLLLASGMAVVATATAGAANVVGSETTPVAIAGVDHIPTVVADMDAAGGRDSRLGLVLRPGRVQDNGLRNLPVTFVDGAGIGLLCRWIDRPSLTALESGQSPCLRGLS